MKKIKGALALLGLCIVIILIFNGFSSIQSDNKLADDSIAFSSSYLIKPVKIPDTVFFAGEEVPLFNFDNFESLDREILINTYWQSQTLLFIKKANRYFPVIEPILEEYNVPLDFKYLAVAESGLSNVVSPSDAAGFWQFLKGTALDYKLEVNDEVDERYHVEKATRAAARFLSESYQKYGSWALAAASYNMGRRNISKFIDKQKADSYYDLVLGEETGRYVYRLIALKLIIESPEVYGFRVEDDEKYQAIDYKIVEVDTSIQSLPDFAHYFGVNYKVLKELNPWLRDNKLTNPHKNKYQIYIATTEKRKVKPSSTFYPEKNANNK